MRTVLIPRNIEGSGCGTLKVWPRDLDFALHDNQQR